MCPLPRPGKSWRSSNNCRCDAVATAGAGRRRDAESEIPTIPDLFAAAGYATASVGKLHLAPTQSHASFHFEECRQRWLDEPALADWHGPYYGFRHVEMTIGHGENVYGHYGHWLDRVNPGQRAHVLSAGREAPRPETGERELYDHVEDPQECRNLAATDTGSVARLHTVLVEQTSRVVAPQAGRISIW